MGEIHGRFYFVLWMERRASHTSGKHSAARNKYPPPSPPGALRAKTCLCFSFFEIIGVCLCVRRCAEPSLQPQSFLGLSVFKVSSKRVKES